MQSRVPYPGWDQMRAVRGQRLCVYGVNDSDVVVRPGPRMAEAARIMARCIAEKLASSAPVAPACSSGARP
jgi:iron complex transport system substrate-binding protein